MGCGSSHKAITPRPLTPPSPTPPPPPTPPSPTPPPPTPTPTPTPTPSPEPSIEFSSDCVDIQIDERKDENPIQETEDDYPDPEPPAPPEQEDRPVVRWFDNDEYQTSSDSDIQQLDIAEDENDIDIDVYSDTSSLGPSTLRYRTPVSKQLPRLSYTAIDEHAKKAEDGISTSFAKLVTYLSSHIPHGDRHRERLIARAIITWLSMQDIDNRSYGTADDKSPRGLLQYLKEGRMTYATCYAILCRRAGIKCTLIKGLVKACKYEPGDTDVPSSPWVAVYAEFSWQLVNPFWVCRALYGHNLGGWVKIETDGSTLAQREEASEGIVRNAFQECYFMPNPEEYVYECYAIDTPWQLLSQEKTVKSKEDFLKLPYLLQPFFGLGLKLTSENTCTLKTKNGKCQIQINANAANAHLLVLRYELFEKDDQYAESRFSKEEHMSRMVFNSRFNEQFVFDLRFPKTGTYKLILYGSPHKSPPVRLCEFQIKCERKMEDGCNLLPVDCHDIGWGPGPQTIEAGLLIPTKPNGLIPVSPNKGKCNIRFQIGYDFIETSEYSATMHGEADDTQTKKTGFEQYINVNTNKRARTLDISVNIPRKGEYGVVITSRPVTPGDVQESRAEEKRVCSYLVSTHAFKGQKANITNAKQKLEDCILECENGIGRPADNIAKVQNCLELCRKQKLDSSDEDIAAAETKLEYLKYKNKLRDCQLRRHLLVTRNTLALLYKYRFQLALKKEISQAEKLEAELRELHGYSRQVPRLEEAHREVVSLHHASKEVYATFKALLMLLGEKEEELHDWGNIQGKLKLSGHTRGDSVFSKMKKISKLDAITIKKVGKELFTYSADEVRKVNSSAHSFYVWIQNVLSVYKKAGHVK